MKTHTFIARQAQSRRHRRRPPESRPDVAASMAGDFVVVWESYGSSGTDATTWSVQGQRFASNGSAQGGQFQVNTYTTSDQFLAAVDASGGGDFVVTWDSLGSPAGSSTPRPPVMVFRLNSASAGWSRHGG